MNPQGSSQRPLRNGVGVGSCSLLVAVMLFPLQFVISNRERIAEWAIKTRMPAISGWAQFAEGGNLMTYGPNLVDTYKRLA